MTPTGVGGHDVEGVLVVAGPGLAGVGFDGEHVPDTTAWRCTRDYDAYVFDRLVPLLPTES